MSNRRGYRGYIGSRTYRGERTPQHIQNLAIRDYCNRNSFTYLLSATEYAMPGCYMMLNEVLREVGKIEGVVLYSIFMLPQQRERRLEVCHAYLNAGATLHGALENISIKSEEDLRKLDEMLMLSQVVEVASASKA